MSTRLAVVTLVGATSVAVAAAAGGYLVLRTNSTEPAASSVPVLASPSGASAAVVESVPPATTPELPAPSQPGEPRTAPTAGRAPAKPDSVASKAATVADLGGSSSASVTPPPVPASVDLPLPDSKESKSDPPVPAAPEPSKRQFEAITVTQDAVMGIRLDSTVSSQTAHVEDKVTARVARDVIVDGRTAIPSGARLEGVVSVVERGGKFKDQARLGIRFQALLLPDGTRVPIQTETIFREGESPTGSASSKVGASAVIGGILGAVIGGKKGAIVGTTAGAAGGTAAVMASGSNDAVIQAGTPLTLRLTSPMTVTIERQQN